MVVIASLLIGIVWMVGATFLFGIKVNYANFAAFPITFGIGVDYAVNIMARFRQERAAGRATSCPPIRTRIVERVVLSTGGAVALCSLTTVIGYSSLLLAKNQALFLFGAVAVHRRGELPVRRAARAARGAAGLALGSRAVSDQKNPGGGTIGIEEGADDSIPRDLGGLSVDGDGGRLPASAGLHQRWRGWPRRLGQRRSCGKCRTTGSGGRGQACAIFQVQAVNKLPPDVLILLDASGSMNNTTDDTACSGGCGAASKWAQLTPALDALVAENESIANWGLKMFADSDATCGVSTGIAAPVAQMNASPIATAIAGRTSANGDLVNGSRTPTRAAVTAGATYLANLDDGNPKLILLLTDGAPNCPAAGDSATDDSTAAVQAVADARARGVPTLVVGIATAGGSAERALNDMAVAGGRARTGATPAYYPVSNIPDLKNTLTPLIAHARRLRARAPAGADRIRSRPPIGLRANGAR